MAGTARGGSGHLGLTHTETQRGRLRTACGQRRVDSKNSPTTPATTSTSSIRQLLGAADAQTAHHATFSTAPTHQLLGSANAEATPARAPAAAADKKGDCPGPREGATTRRNVTQGGRTLLTLAPSPYLGRLCCYMLLYVFLLHTCLVMRRYDRLTHCELFVIGGVIQASFLLFRMRCFIFGRIILYDSWFVSL